MSNILSALNARQSEAVAVESGPVLVIAGPGSGKTRVLTHRIAYLIAEQNVYASKIMAVTFTNKAAREMKERVERLIGGDEGRYVTLGTFHAICARILRIEAEHTEYNGDFVIYDTTDQTRLITQIMTDMGIDSKRVAPRAIRNAISSAKNEMITPDRMVINNYDAEIAQRVYLEYEKRMKRSQARDFDDLLTHTVRLFRRYPLVLEKYHRGRPYILVDEFQDTNMVQYELVRLMANPDQNLFVVGDPDQSIYAFRGADYRNIQRFKRDFEPREVILQENYRSHQRILDAAMAVIRKNPDHIQRQLVSTREEGKPIVIHEAHNDREEAQYVLDLMQSLASKHDYDMRDFGVLYRTNAQSRVLEETFVRAGVPYLLVGATRFYGRKEIKDVLAYLRVLHNPYDAVGMERIINTPPRGIGPKTLSQFYNWSESLSGGMWEALQTLDRDEPTPLSGRSKTTLTTFAKMMVQLHKTSENSTPLELMDAVLDATQYIEYLQRDKSDTTLDRVENVAELRRVANEYADYPLSDFLTEVVLVSEVDNLDDERANAPTFLTLHAAKGLEFPIVFMVGLEEGILPHSRSLNDEAQMSEERRLMYVGLTRARDNIYLSYAFHRMMWGNSDITTPSRFLGDIPPDISSGFVGIKQPPRGHIYHNENWSTDWKPIRTRSSSSTGQTPTARPTREPEPEVLKKFRSSQKVYHPKFGDGIVISSKVNSGVEVVEVLFKQVGKKRLDGSFLEIVE